MVSVLWQRFDCCFFRPVLRTAMLIFSSSPPHCYVCCILRPCRRIIRNITQTFRKPNNQRNCKIWMISYQFRRIFSKSVVYFFWSSVQFSFWAEKFKLSKIKTIYNLVLVRPIQPKINHGRAALNCTSLIAQIKGLFDKFFQFFLHFCNPWIFLVQIDLGLNFIRASIKKPL